MSPRQISDWRRRPKRQQPVADARQPSHLAIGKIVGKRGIRGELKVDIESEDPQRFYSLREVYLGRDLTQFSVRRARLFKNQALLQLEGIDDPDTAQGWRGAYVYVTIADALPLRQGEYYFCQIEGLTAVTDEGEKLGRIDHVMPTGSNDVYVVKGNRGEILIPALVDVILDVDLEAETVTVHLPEGLID